MHKIQLSFSRYTATTISFPWDRPVEELDLPGLLRGFDTDDADGDGESEDILPDSLSQLTASNAKLRANLLETLGSKYLDQASVFTDVNGQVWVVATSRLRNGNDNSWSRSRPLSLVDNKQVYSLTLPTTREDIILINAGVIAVVGGTESGKTYFLGGGLTPSIREQGIPVTHVTYGEDVVTAGSTLAWDPLDLLHILAAEAIVAATNKEKRVVIVDSIREFVYMGSDGGTGEGGFNMLIPVQTTALSNALSAYGVLAILALNPMVSEDKPAVLAKVIKDFQSSVNTMYITRTASQRAGSVKYFLRGELNRDRPIGESFIRDLSSFEHDTAPDYDLSVDIDVGTTEHYVAAPVDSSYAEAVRGASLRGAFNAIQSSQLDND